MIIKIKLLKYTIDRIKIARFAKESGVRGYKPRLRKT